jgi:hypothetical protein
MPYHRRHIIDSEQEPALVRDCIRELATQMQEQGEIPPDVTQAELYRATDKHVPAIMDALRKNPMYPQWKAAGHLREHIRQLVSLTLQRPPSFSPAVARDQISYVDTSSGQTLTPTWKHRGCGGTVYPSDELNTFRCSKCQQTGALGAEMPDCLTRPQQMEYMLTQVEEVDLGL